jgi:hypothetical protein
MATSRKHGGRARTGTILPTPDGRLQAVITLADGSRKRLPPFPKRTSKTLAKEKAAFWSAEAIRRGLVAAPKPGKLDPSSGTAWWTSYLEHREARGLSPVMHLYRPHIEPIIAAHPEGR